MSTTRPTITFLRRGDTPPALATEGAGFTDATVAAALAAGILPIETGSVDGPVAAWIVDPADALAIVRRGVGAWRVTVRHTGRDEDVLDALARTEAPFLRTTRESLREAVAICALPAICAAPQIEVATVDEAVEAVLVGAGDLILDGWGHDGVARLRDALPTVRLVERTLFPVGLAVDAIREALARPLLKAYLDQIDGDGAARPRYAWAPGKDIHPPVPARRLSAQWDDAVWNDASARGGIDHLSPDLAGILDRSLSGEPPTRDEVERLFRARGEEVEAVAWVADRIRERVCGDTVTYVVNRNINYTNLCYFRCGFCGFSKGPKSLNLRGDPYLVSTDEVVARSVEAWELGATEVCLQGGIHPDFTGDFYVGIVEGIKAKLPAMHVHGFTALEVWQGAHTLGISVRDLLVRLRDAGLGTLPGTAAEVLDDDVRRHLCPDKIRTAQWAQVHITAHELGLRSNNTLMFGHIDGPASWANHVEVAREIQRRTGGFTEFVPLPFVHMGAPIYLQGRARPGPTWDEVVLVHAVARIAFDGLIPNIQASWVKLGLDGGGRLLDAGCNDLGGTLMDENISRAAGASHGQLATPEQFREVILATGRIPLQRTTTYGVIEDPRPAFAGVG
jgi:7,8-didemethyl-8-hydroxy-5-deazariboflavin synthase CofH subunit